MGITVEVAAVPPSPLATFQIGANLRDEATDALPTGRTIARVAELAPGLTDNGPRSNDRQQLTVGGSFAYDNVFLINGVDVNDNLWGGPENLFIEDAFDEVQVLTAGISAEYGRFTGGVVNAVTRSGSDTFSGSLRVNLSNPAWIAETPFERAAGTEREDDLSKFFEETIGGPLIRQRLWFFFGGRNERSSSGDAFNETGIPFTRTREDNRYLIKLTGSPAQGHTLEGTYLRNNTETFGPSTQFSIDPAALVTRSDPADLAVATYRGVLGSQWFGELQVSRKTKETKEDRTVSTALRDSSFFAFDFPLRQYNAPHFDFVNDPEERNNQQVTGNLSYFLSTESAGSHAIKSGAERFTSTRIGGNSQSQTGFAYDANFKTDASGQPIFDGNGRLVPLWIPGGALIETITADRGAQLDVRTTSLFLQDNWALNDRWSVMLGMRFENVSSEATGNFVGVDTSTVVPRLGASYDVGGDGQHVVKATYGHYAGSYNLGLLGQNTTVGNPTNLFGIYGGPAGEGLDFAPGFDPDNYTTLGCFTCPPEIVSFDDVSSPLTKEFTLSGGAALGRGGHVQLTYVNRTTDNFMDDVISLDTGATTLVRGGVDLGTFSNRVFRNTDELRRDYQALVLQGRQSVTERWTVDGHWTIQLENDGNFEGESRGNPTEPSPFGNYAPLLNATRHYPSGRLAGFQRHKLRLWSIYNLDFGQTGSLDLAGIWRYESGRRFSFQSSAPLTTIQRSLGADFVDLPRQTVFFGERGRGSFKGYGLLDVSATYGLRVWQSVEPWLKVEFFNLLNNDKLIAFNTSVSPDPDGSTDELGLPTNFVRGPRFGEATSNEHFPTPFPGETGGRAFQIAFGVRF